MKIPQLITGWFSGRLTQVLVVLGTALFAGLLSLLAVQTYRVGHLEKKLEAQLVTTGSQAEKLTAQEATLADLADKRDQLVKNLAEAQEAARKIRTVTQVKVQKILVEKWPEDCQAAAVKARDIVQAELDARRK